MVAAAKQVERIGTTEANEAARQILVDTRRGLYRLLADDDAATTTD